MPAIIEPGHFRFAAIGELVLQLEARLFYTHRGIEKLAEGRTPEAGASARERMCGACALSHSVAFCEAVESLASVPVPPRAQWARTILLELERLYNHLGDAGNICAGTGFAVGTMRGAVLKERLQQLNERLVGHRFLRGACAPGRLAARSRDGRSCDRSARARGAARRDARFTHLLVEHEGFVDRLRGTGRLDAATVRALGGVGPAARAAGVDVDLRRDRPYAAYADLEHAAAHSRSTRRAMSRRGCGNAWPKPRCRSDCSRSCSPTRPAGPSASRSVRLEPHRLGVWAPSSRPAGPTCTPCCLMPRVASTRYRVRSASFPNWPLVPLAVPGNLMPDFPLINKSFELCYACLDR